MSVSYKTFAFWLFGLFSYFYLITASSMPLSAYSSILRWVGSFLLLFFSLLITLRKKGIKNIVLPSEYLFLIVALIPSLLGLGGDATIYSYGRIISLFLVIFALMFFFKMDFFDRSDLLRCFEIYTFVCGIMMIVSSIVGKQVMGRLAGVYDNANLLSCIAAFSLAASIGCFFLTFGKKRRIFYLIFALFSCYCVFATGSRMGAVCAIITIVSVPIINRKNNSFNDYLKLFFAIVTIFVIALVVVNHFEIVGIQRLLGVFDSEVSSSLGLTRGDTWSDVIKIFSEKPIFGWGYAQVGYRVFVVFDTAYNWGVHSSYFMILIEMGIVGSVLFALFFIFSFNKVRRLYKKDNNSFKDKLFAKYLMLICLIMLVNAYSESHLFSLGNPMSPCFWLPFELLTLYFYKDSNASLLQQE